MSRFSRFLSSVVAFSLLFGLAVSAAGMMEMVEVSRNTVNLKVNGQAVSADNFLYNNTTYVPLRAVANLLGAGVGWDDATRTVSLTTGGDRSPVVKQIAAPVDPYAPQIDLAQLGLSPEQVDGIKLERGGQLVAKKIGLAGGKLVITDEEAAYGGNVLDFEQPYRLKLFATGGTPYVVDFVTGGLPDITDHGTRRVILVPAMPEKGFHWPYLLAVPSDKYRAENQGNRRYLVVDTINTGPGNSFQEAVTGAREQVINQNQHSITTAEKLWAPFIMPVFPRPMVHYHDEEFKVLLTHSLDRVTARLHLDMARPQVAANVRESFRQAGHDVEQYLRLDLQVIAMMDHAIAYLNQHGHGVQPKKVFMAGFSASGTFSDRFSALHPDRVKAVAAGATPAHAMLPLATLGGKELIFPIGTSDYQEITGRPFDLNQYNQVARLFYQGDNDLNNPVLFMDSHGDRERDIIISLLGREVLPRARKTIEVFGQAGGKGIFILDRGIGHHASLEMVEYIRLFLAANRESDRPVYPRPENPEQLQYTLYDH